MTIEEAIQAMYTGSCISHDGILDKLVFLFVTNAGEMNANPSPDIPISEYIPPYADRLIRDIIKKSDQTVKTLELPQHIYGLSSNLKTIVHIDGLDLVEYEYGKGLSDGWYTIDISTIPDYRLKAKKTTTNKLVSTTDRYLKANPNARPFITTKQLDEIGRPTLLQVFLQTGPSETESINGVSMTQLLELVREYFVELQDQLPCTENTFTVSLIEEALKWQAKRKHRRNNLNILGKFIEGVQ